MFPFRTGNGARSKRRIRVCEHDEPKGGACVVSASELADSHVSSVMNNAEVIGAGVAASCRLSVPCVDMEFYPPSMLTMLALARPDSEFQYVALLSYGVYRVEVLNN